MLYNKKNAISEQLIATEILSCSSCSISKVMNEKNYKVYMRPQMMKKINRNAIIMRSSNKRNKYICKLVYFMQYLKIELIKTVQKKECEPIDA